MVWATLGDSRLMRQWAGDLYGQVYTTMSQVDMDLASNIKVALYDNTTTPSVDATNLLSTYGGASSVFTSTGGATGVNQVFAAGWAQGGLVLPTPALSQVAGGITQFSSAAIVSTTTTLSNIVGMFLYFPNATLPANQANAGLGYWYFGATPFSVTAGILTVTPNASGLFRLTS